MTSMNSSNAQQVLSFVEEYCALLTKKGIHKEYESLNHVFSFTKGKRYYKIIESCPHRSVHAFVDKNTGDVYKPASWNAPAIHIRFNLLNDESRQQCFENADIYGSYLYLK